MELGNYKREIYEEILEYSLSLHGATKFVQDSPKRYPAGVSYTTFTIPTGNWGAFFNTMKMKASPLNVHDHHPMPCDRKRWCVLSGKESMVDGKKGRTTVYLSRRCIVPLCPSVPENLVEKCWYAWHMTQTIVPRQMGGAIRRTENVSTGPTKLTIRRQRSISFCTSAGESLQGNVSNVTKFASDRNWGEHAVEHADSQTATRDSSVHLRRSNRSRSQPSAHDKESNTGSDNDATSSHTLPIKRSTHQEHHRQ